MVTRVVLFRQKVTDQVCFERILKQYSFADELFTIQYSFDAVGMVSASVFFQAARGANGDMNGVLRRGW
jgi:hypothetical protein